MIRFATIGTSAIVDRFLEAAALCEGLVHTAVFSRKKETAKAFAKKHGAEFIYTDLKELAESSDIDAVYIASPNSCHCEQAVEMLKHGKHVLCEKPAASNAAELQRMRAAAENGQAVLLEAMRSVYDPGFQAIEANLYRLGKIRSVSFRFCQYSSRYDNFRKGIIENAFRPELSNGALMDIGVYCVHPLVRLFGMPEKIEGASVFLENGVDGREPSWRSIRAGRQFCSIPKLQVDIRKVRFREKTGVCRSIGSQIQEKLRYMSVLGAEM